MSEQLGTCLCGYGNHHAPHARNQSCGKTWKPWQPVPATAEPVAGETKRCQVCNDTGLECISRKTEAGDYDETFKPCTVCGRKPAYAMTPPAPSVAGETKYAPLDTKACFNTAAHFEHSWDYRNKTFRCLGKPICPSVAVPEGEATNVKGESIDLWTNNR